MNNARGRARKLRLARRLGLAPPAEPRPSVRGVPRETQGVRAALSFEPSDPIRAMLRRGRR
jgi:hypothetical protein